MILVAALLMTIIVGWGRTQPRIWVGQVATESLVNPRSFELPDRAETERQQEVARIAAPRFYQANTAVLDDLRAKIAGLPVAVRSVTVLDEVDPELRERFELKDGSLSILKRFAGPNGPDAAPNWREWTDEFVRRLWRVEPLLETQEFQKFSTVSSRRVLPPRSPVQPGDEAENTGNEDTIANRGAEVSVDAATDEPNSSLPPRNLADAVRISDAVDLTPEVGDPSIRKAVERLAETAGFSGAAARIVAAAIATKPAPTILYDASATEEAADLAAARIVPVEISHPAGEVIYRRGDVIGLDELATAREALTRAFSGGFLDSGWGQVPGWMLLALVLILMLAGHGVIFYPRIAHSTARLTAVVLLLVAATGLATAFAAMLPRLAPFGAALAVSILSIALALAYDRRIAIFASVLVAIALTVSTGQKPAATIAVLATAFHT